MDVCCVDVYNLEMNAMIKVIFKKGSGKAINNIDIAVAMDEINKQSIMYYCRQLGEAPCPNRITTFLNKKNKKITLTVVQLAIDLMESDGYIKTIRTKYDPEVVESFSHTEKGLGVFLKGGFVKGIEQKNREKKLVITGQISVFLAGIYYLLELLKNFY